MRATRRIPLLVARCLGCATPPDEGERRYREGDRRGALEAWKEAPPGGDPRVVRTAERIAEVERELDSLVDVYIERAQRLESEGRLAESLLDYRLALVEQPDDHTTLAHVQQLARELTERRAQLEAEYQQQLDRREPEDARVVLARLRTLDPFDASYETEERRLSEVLAAEWRQRRQRVQARVTTEVERIEGEVESLVNEGRDAFREERLDVALAAWRKALLMDPSNERIQAYIARAESQLENLERLRESERTEDEG